MGRNSQDSFLNDIREITSLPSLTGWQMRNITLKLIADGEIFASEPTEYMLPGTYRALRDFLMDDNNYNIGRFQKMYNELAKKQLERTKAYRDSVKKESDMIDAKIYKNPEEDMDSVSDELLNADDVAYNGQTSKDDDIIYEAVMAAISKGIRMSIHD